MTEQDWLTADDPLPMLDHVKGRSYRKARLFACAACRRLWDSMEFPASRKAVEASELFADRLIPQRSLMARHGGARTAWKKAKPAGAEGFRRRNAAVLAAEAAYVVSESHQTIPTRERLTALLPVYTVRFAVTHAYLANGEGADREEATQLCELVRDIFGNPFRPAVIHPDWLTWNGGTVVKLARTIYEDRRWEIMPILGDALEDAMCDNDDILTHCRGPGPHARGCWVVDLILGKE